MHNTFLHRKIELQAANQYQKEKYISYIATEGILTDIKKLQHVW